MKYYIFLLSWLMPLKFYLCTFNFQGKNNKYQYFNVKIFLATIPQVNFKNTFDLLLVR